MSPTAAQHGLELRSLARADGTLELSLVEVRGSTSPCLAEALDPKVAAIYAQRATGAKYLINPQKGLS